MTALNKPIPLGCAPLTERFDQTITGINWRH